MELFSPKKGYAGWRKIQDIWEEYLSSFQFDSMETVKEWLMAEYPDEVNEWSAKTDKFNNRGDLCMEF